MPDIIGVLKKYALPDDTRVAAMAELHSCQHLGLILDKFQPWGYCRWNDNMPNSWDLYFEYLDRGNPKIADGNAAKGHWLNDDSGYRPVEPKNKLKPNSRFDSTLFNKFKERWLNALPVEPFTLFSQDHTVVGLGAKGTLEMGLTLHHTYGFPIIPGSSLKGLSRTFALLRIAEDLEIPRISSETILALKAAKQDAPLRILDTILEMPLPSADTDIGNSPQYQAMEAAYERKLKGHKSINIRGCQIETTSFETFLKWDFVQKFRTMFGTQNEAGKAIFFDAIPDVIENIIAVEIMTPHYAGYYQEDKFPQDDQNLKPLAYLSIQQGIPFHFCIAPRSKDRKDQELVKFAEALLRLSLKQIGIGGKTSSGLGRFSNRRPFSINRKPNSR